MARDIYSTAAWRAARRRVLERDGYECQLRLLGCAGRADAVDHTVELFEGGLPFDDANLVAACMSCNSRKHMSVLARRAGSRVRAW